MKASRAVAVIALVIDAVDVGEGGVKEIIELVSDFFAAVRFVGKHTCRPQPAVHRVSEEPVVVHELVLEHRGARPGVVAL